jgi:outer membrane protein assembly factor BamB
MCLLTLKEALSMRPLFLAACLLVSSALFAQEAVTHRFICADNGLNKVFVVGTDGQIEWDFDVPVGQDVWRLANGNYLVSHLRGAWEITPDKQIVWRYDSPEGTEVHTCQPLPDGKVMVIECGTSRIVEVGRDGKITKEVPLKTSTTGVHGQFRNGRKLANGNYLVAFVGENRLVEVDGEGKEVWSYNTPGNCFAGVRLPDGNTLIPCGDGHKLIEINPQKEIVWEIDENELPGNPLRFVAGVQRLPNGNTVVCNWGGHGFIGQQPLIFEVTRDKRVVWELKDYQRFRTISHLMLLDVDGDPAAGEVLR